MRWLFLMHRYLGMAIGLLMAVWSLSGIVMLYVDYPSVTETQRLAGLSPIAWRDCCNAGDSSLLPDAQPILAARLETLAGTPVVRLQRTGQTTLVIDLGTGHALGPLDLPTARAIAESQARNRNLGESPLWQGPLEHDQWTVAGPFNRHRPLFHFALPDPAKTEFYISGTTGDLVQMTTHRQRFWNWLGAVPHWLYPTLLRQNVALWSQIVIYTSLLGSFLTLTGLIAGIARVRRRSAGAWSPYRGFALWHHASGLIFGILLLAWVTSGLLSMNPWGLLESKAGNAAEKLQGAPLSWRQIKQAIAALPPHLATEAVLSLDATPYAERLYWIAAESAGKTIRLDDSGTLAPLTADDLAQAAERLAGTASILSQEMIVQEDSYYFRRHDDDAPLPAYRVILNDDQQTRYYLDPVSGRLLRTVDRNARRYRWLHDALHRWDFIPALYRQPGWTIGVVVLLIGVASISLTGVFLAFRRMLMRNHGKISGGG